MTPTDEGTARMTYYYTALIRPGSLEIIPGRPLVDGLIWTRPEDFPLRIHRQDLKKLKLEASGICNGQNIGYWGGKFHRTKYATGSRSNRLVPLQDFAADPRRKFGTMLWFPRLRQVGYVADRGGKIKDKPGKPPRFDRFIESYAILQALRERAPELADEVQPFITYAPPAVPREFNLRGVKSWQRALNLALGLKGGNELAIDGDFGSRTHAKMIVFSFSRGMSRVRRVQGNDRGTKDPAMHYAMRCAVAERV